jgi:hypothetical protein
LVQCLEGLRESILIEAHPITGDRDVRCRCRVGPMRAHVNKYQGEENGSPLERFHSHTPSGKRTQLFHYKPEPACQYLGSRSSRVLTLRMTRSSAAICSLAVAFLPMSKYVGMQKFSGSYLECPQSSNVRNKGMGFDYLSLNADSQGAALPAVPHAGCFRCPQTSRHSPRLSPFTAHYSSTPEKTPAARGVLP